MKWSHSSPIPAAGQSNPSTAPLGEVAAQEDLQRLGVLLQIVAEGLLKLSGELRRRNPGLAG